MIIYKSSVKDRFRWYYNMIFHFGNINVTNSNRYWFSDSGRTTMSHLILKIFWNLFSNKLTSTFYEHEFAQQYRWLFLISEYLWIMTRRNMIHLPCHLGKVKLKITYFLKFFCIIDEIQLFNNPIKSVCIRSSLVNLRSKFQVR